MAILQAIDEYELMVQLLFLLSYVEKNYKLKFAIFFYKSLSDCLLSFFLSLFFFNNNYYVISLKLELCTEEAYKQNREKPEAKIYIQAKTHHTKANLSTKSRRKLVEKVKKVRNHSES